MGEFYLFTNEYTKNETNLHDICKMFKTLKFGDLGRKRNLEIIKLQIFGHHFEAKTEFNKTLNQQSNTLILRIP